MAESLMPLDDSPEVRRNWVRAGIKGIPYIGSSIDELMYGQLDEIRWRRLEDTLGELAEAMRSLGIPADETAKEEFGRLLEDVAPAVAGSTSQQKRRLLRDLLLNAVRLESADPQWESARLAADLLSPLSYAAVEVLAALHRLDSRESGKLAELRLPAPPDRPVVVLEDESQPPIEMSYERFVVDEGYRQLTETSARRLVVAGAHGRNKYEHIGLTELGTFVIEWAVDADTVDEVDDTATANGV